MESEPSPSTSLGVLASLLDLQPANDHRGAEPAGPVAHLALVGPPDHPRFLVPVDHGPATRYALLAYNRLRPLKTRATRAMLAGGTKVGVARFAFTSTFTIDVGPDSFIHHLCELLGVANLQAAVGVGNFDPVWKPTIQCFDPDGTPLAYAKVGVGPVGSHLVQTETGVLTKWAEHEDPRLVVPRPLATTAWQGQPVVVCEPMPSDARRLPDGTISAWPARTLDDPIGDRPLQDATWWTTRTADHHDHPVVEPLMDAVETHHGSRALPWARWHGDWVPWNLARSRRGLVAWDWEYSEPGAPVGLDEIHGRYQVQRIVNGHSVSAALATAHRGADPWTADAHLVMLATRHALLERLAGTPIGDHHEVMAAAMDRTRSLSSPAP